MRHEVALTAIILSIFLISGQLYAATDDGLIAYYPFDGDATDVSENGNDGTEYGGVVNVDGVNYVDGVLGQAVNFDGVDDYIALPNLSSDNITITIWIKENDQGVIFSDGGPTIIDGLSSGGFVGLSYDYLNEDAPSLVGFDSPGYYIKANFHPRYNSTERYEGRALIHKINLNDSKWHFIAMSYDNNNNVASLFVDGIKEVELNFSLVPHDQNSGGYQTTYSLGSWKSFDNYNFTGIIDDVRFYNRILTGPEIQELYNKGDDASVCIQDSFGGQCVAYVRNQMGGNYDSMPGLCKYNADCGAYNAWGNWDLGYGIGGIPEVDSVMVLDQQAGLRFGHVVIVRSVKAETDDSYALLVDESNWSSDELVDCDVEYIYDAVNSVVVRNGVKSPITVLGFIYSMPAQAQDSDGDKQAVQALL